MARKRGAGRLRHRVTLQKLTEGADAYGDIGETWTDAVGYTIPAFIRPMQSRERVEAQAVRNLVTHHVYMRYRNDVTPDRRLLWNDNGTDHVLNIEYVIDIDNARVELDIECKEVVQ